MCLVIVETLISFIIFITSVGVGHKTLSSKQWKKKTLIVLISFGQRVKSRAKWSLGNTGSSNFLIAPSPSSLTHRINQESPLSQPSRFSKPGQQKNQSNHTGQLQQPQEFDKSTSKEPQSLPACRISHGDWVASTERKQVYSFQENLIYLRDKFLQEHTKIACQAASKSRRWNSPNVIWDEKSEVK